MPRIEYEEGFKEALEASLAAAAAREGPQWAETVRRFIEEILQHLPRVCAEAEELDRQAADAINGPELEEGGILLCRILRPRFRSKDVFKIYLEIRTSFRSIASDMIHDAIWKIHDNTPEYRRTIMPLITLSYSPQHEIVYVEIFRWIV